MVLLSSQDLMSVSGTPEAPARGAEAPSPWPPEALALAQHLQRRLSLDDRQWHQLKAQRPRRAAEQLAAALVQLLAADDPKRSAPTPARQEAIALVEHALGWLRSEVSDPGCPSHGR
jgi:selenocysteine lyase/cysteine desulfurase